MYSENIEAQGTIQRTPGIYRCPGAGVSYSDTTKSKWDEWPVLFKNHYLNITAVGILENDEPLGRSRLCQNWLIVKLLTIMEKRLYLVLP